LGDFDNLSLRLLARLADGNRAVRGAKIDS